LLFRLPSHPPTRAMTFCRRAPHPPFDSPRVTPPPPPPPAAVAA
jgi:hypothetical protein